MTQISVFYNHTLLVQLKTIHQTTSMGINFNKVLLNHSRPANFPRYHIFTPRIVKLVNLVMAEFYLAFRRLLLEFHGLLMQTTSAPKSPVPTGIASGRIVFGPAVEAFASVGLHAFFADVAMMAVQRAFRPR